MSSDAIPIVVSTDSTYQKYTATMLQSLFESSKADAPEIYVLKDPEDKIDLVERVCRTVGAPCHELNITVEKFDDVTTWEHLDIQTYFRIVAPKLLPDTVDKFLYLDSDMLIRDDIAGLYGKDFDTALAASPESEDKCILKEEIPQYHNAGVLLVNRRKWLSNNYSDRGLELMRKHCDSFQWADQDLLNYMCKGDFTQINPLWNVTRAKWTKDKTVLDEAKIMHFTGPMKPWHKLSLNPMRHQFRRCAQRANIDIMSKNLFDGMSISYAPFYVKYSIRLMLERTGLYQKLRS